MKTAVSIADDVFEGAERLARRLKRSRSELYTAAVREYVARHEPDAVTAALDALYAEHDSRLDPGLAAAAARRLAAVEW